MSEDNTLNEEELNEKLKEIPNWQKKDNAIVREIQANNFAAAVGIVNSIAITAEKADHHPDILIYGWNKLRITLSTHDKGGLTGKDIDLAQKIEELGF